ncbi:MAG TPA: hypothetical protein VMY05_07695 [Acidobacteriota bacterium]|nr:hypothetical protein [Acidobacteriota bacterium]
MAGERPGPRPVGKNELVVSQTLHNQGNIQFTFMNDGNFAWTPRWDPAVDPVTGDRVIYCIYPRNSDNVYMLMASLAVGGVVDGDTLVTCAEFWPDLTPYGAFDYQSIDVSRALYSEKAHSMYDIICQYSDTCTDPNLVSRWHVPLELTVKQRSMAWSGGRIGEFILFDFEVTTTGTKRIEDVFVGFHFATGVGHWTWPTSSGNLWGFLKSRPSPEGCDYRDIVNVAYFMENDGSPVDGRFDYRSPLAAMGLSILGMPSRECIVNYNWFTSVPGYEMVWHPRRKPRPGERLRDFGSGSEASWFGMDHANQYYLMSHPEFDYDAITTAIDKSDQGWMPPPPYAEEIAAGDFGFCLLSFGPFDLGPGNVLPFTIAVVAGDSVHHDPTAYDRLFNAHFPFTFYEQLDFSNLAENAKWARWVYDNPGVDTDGDGDSGLFRVCNGDTTWYQGDGVPDFRADLPPSAPFVKILPSTGKLIIRWNGYFSETTIDPFTRVKDFEGYRVYAGLDTRKSSMTLLSSWDHHNFNRYTLTQLADSSWKWICHELPFTLDSLTALYDNPDLDPLHWTRANPLNHLDTFYYFTTQDYNVSDLTNRRQIHKAYPEITVPPPEDSALWTEDELTYEHGRPLPKFYEYEYVYDRVLPTIPYFVAVTAFDFGFAKGGIPAKESSLLNNLIEAYAQMTADLVEEAQLDAYVYPNPWRVDEDYHERGFENRDNRQIPGRSHRIHFANLPNVCKISIYSLDGDLIREIDHDFPAGGPEAMHDEWDFITDYTMRVVSGLYYYVIESQGRTQIGTFAIIW